MKHFTGHTLLMRILTTTLLLLVTGNILRAQNQRITLDMEQASLPEVLHQLEETSGYKFSYKDQIFATGLRVTVKEKNKTIEEILDKLLKPLELDYYFFKDKIILILEKNPEKKDNENISRTIQGFITEESGHPLAGATIRIQDGTSPGTISDKNGSFTLEYAAKQDTISLLISYIGFKSQKVEINRNSSFPLTIALHEDLNKLEEIIIVGYGAVKKSNLTGAVSSIKGSKLPVAGQTNVNSLLQGRIAGLNILQTSAIPGGEFDFSIRGKASTGAGNDPLVVVDGFPMRSIKDLEIINPNNIESIEVLKDASATAIYGARAANGVLLINTCKGEKGTTRVSVRSNVSLQTISNPLKMMKARELMEATNYFYYEDYLYQNRKGVYANLGNPPSTEIPLKIEYTDEEIAHAADITNWMDEITRNGLIVDNHISLTGGENKTKYLVSFSSYNQKGVLETSDYTKLSGSGYLEIDLSNRIHTGVNLTFSKASVNNPELSSNSDYAGIIRDASAYPTFYPIHNEDGSYFINPKHPNYPNPVSWKEVHNLSEITRILISNYWLIQPTRSLDMRLSWGSNMQFTRNEKQYPKSHLIGIFTNTQASIGESRNNQHLLDLTATWKHEVLTGHQLKFMIGYAYQKFLNKDVYAQGKGYISDVLGINNLEFGNPALNEIGSGKSVSKYISWFGRLNYDIHDKYLATFTIRADGSDKFGENNKYGYFPSLAIAWRASEEPFLKKHARWLSDLKFRLSLGQTGNANIGGNAYAMLSPGADYVFNNHLTTGVLPSQLANPNLKWETTTEINWGIDFSLFKNRISGSVDLYQKTISDLLDRRSVGSMYPVSTVYDNLGKTQSRGIEIELSTINLINRHFSWQSQFSFASYKDRWKERNPYTILSVYNSNTDPLHVRWGYKSDGLIKEGDVLPHMPGAPVGTIKVLDLNGWAKDKDGNFILNKNGQKTLTKGPDGTLDDADKVIIAQSVPDFTFGINNTFTYKNIDLTIFLTGEVGRERWNETLLSDLIAEKFRFGDNVSVYAHQMWRSDRQQAKYPSGVYTAYDSNTDFWVEQCNFIRLKSLVLGYTMPAGLINKLKLFKSLRFSLEGQNLFLLSSYTSGDPETDRYMAYFNQRTFTVGVTLGF